MVMLELRLVLSITEIWMVWSCAASVSVQDVGVGGKSANAAAPPLVGGEPKAVPPGMTNEDGDGLVSLAAPIGPVNEEPPPLKLTLVASPCALCAIFRLICVMPPMARFSAGKD